MLNKKSPKPTDPKLYQKIKEKIYKEQPKHSAYRSGRLVSEYKRAYCKKYGARASPYIKQQQQRMGPHTKKSPTGLTRWFAEEWRNSRGEVGYKYENDVYRPTKRISQETPITFSELSATRIAKARAQKKRTGRVVNFRKVGAGNNTS